MCGVSITALTLDTLDQFKQVSKLDTFNTELLDNYLLWHITMYFK